MSIVHWQNAALGVFFAFAAATGLVPAPLLATVFAWAVLALGVALAPRVWSAAEHDRSFRAWLLGGFFLIFLAAAFTPATNRYVTWQECVRLCSLWGFTTLLLYCFRYYPWSAGRFFRVYVGGAVLLAGFGLFHYLTGGTPRLTAFWANPSLVGAFLIPAFLILLNSPGGGGRRRAALGILWLALLCTWSRGIAAALLVSLPVGAVDWRRPVRIRWRVAGLIALLLGANFLFGLARWQGRGDPQAYARGRIWDSVGHVVLAHPWRGVGGGCLGDVVAAYKFPSLVHPFYWGQLARHAHNEYLHLAAEWGLPALIVFLSALAIFLRRVARAGGGELPGLGWALVVFLLHSGIDNLWHFLPTALLAAALVAALLPRTWRAPLAVAPPAIAPGLLLLVVGIALFITVPPAVGDYYLQRGLAAEGAGELRAALGDYERATTWSPLAGMAHMVHGGAWLKLAKAIEPIAAGQVPQYLAESRRQFELGLECEPRNPVYRSHLGRIYLLTGEPFRAEAEVREAVRELPTNVILYSRLSWFSRQRQDDRRAALYSRRAAAIEPLYSDAYLDLARLQPRNDFWPAMALAAHRFNRAYIEHLDRTELTSTSIINYVVSLQEYPATEYAALVAATDTPAVADGRLWQ